MSRIGLLFSFLVLAPALPAQDVQQAFGEGMASYRAGDFEAAIQNFRQVVSLAPDQLVALELLNDSQDALLELMVAGGEFETFALEIIEAASEAGREAIRDGDAVTEAASGCFSDSYGDRARAIFQLGARFGPFAATPLVAELASQDEGRRLGANYALSRLGSEIVEPLLAASHSTNVEVRLGCLLVFAQLEDPRTAARIADLALHDEDGSVRAMAAKLGGGSASDLLFSQGLAYVSNGAAGLSPAENHGVLWDVSGATLSFYEVPYSLVPLELAKHCFLRSSELGNPHAGVELAHAYASEIAILAGLVADGDDSFEDSLHAQKAAALTLGGSVLDGALRKAVAIGGNAVAIELIALLDGPGKVPSAGLDAALASGSPGVRSAAAIAKAGMGAHDPVVAAVLAQAMNLDAARVVHIIDPVDERASTLASNLEDAGVTVTRASSGADGLVNMHLGTAADAVVVADPLSDLYAHRVVSEIQRDLRNVDTAIFVLGNDSTADIDGAEIVESLDSGSVTSAFSDLDARRAGYLATAAAAARAMATVAAHGGASGHCGAIAEATGREDAVAIPAMAALGWAGGVLDGTSLEAVIAESSRSSEARVAAADALAVLASRTGAEVNSQVLESAMTEGNVALAASCARALGAAAAGHVPAMVVAG
jgi:hypothetical protein